jgi:hypothetical protein
MLPRLTAEGAEPDHNMEPPDDAVPCHDNILGRPGREVRSD